MTQMQLPSDHPKKKSLCLPTSIPGSDYDASWWMVHKVDPHYDAFRRQNSSIRKCIGHTYVHVYEVGSRVVTLKSYILYFLPDIPEFMDETPRNLLDAFTVHGPPWHGLGPVPYQIDPDKTSHRKIPLSLEAARFVFETVPSLWNLRSASAALLLRRLCQKFQNDAKTLTNLEASRLHEILL